MNELPLRIVGALTGLAVVGEALALVVGVHLVGKGNSAWISVKNDLLLALDVLVGLGLVLLAVLARGPAWPYNLYALVGLGLMTHGYRVWEYLAGVANPFCANVPLFIFNDVKLAGLGACLLIAVASGGALRWN
ncbi:MAG: hypothetical protein P8129_21750 [Anaerolineae bacterium]